MKNISILKLLSLSYRDHYICKPIIYNALSFNLTFNKTLKYKNENAKVNF